MKHPGGRPSTYTPEIGDRICEIVSTDTACLDELCAKYPEMPDSAATIYKWRFKNKEFGQKYLEAMHNRGNLYAEETLKIASEKPTYVDTEGNQRVDAGAVAWLKLNVNLRQWHASKLAPKTYGDKNKEEEKKTIDSYILEELKEVRKKLEEKNRKEY